MALDDPRICVSTDTATSPAASRASQTGSRIGGLAPISPASQGSQSATFAGSSSVMLYTPGRPRVSAATVAAAASSVCRNDQTPPASPTSGSFRCRVNPSTSFAVPGPYSAPYRSTMPSRPGAPVTAFSR